MFRNPGWKLALAVTLLVLLVTSLPYTFAYLTAPEERTFVGIQLNMIDHQQYFSWMRSHQNGLLINNRLTPEPNEPVFFNALWWAMAQLANLTGWDYPALYQLLRWASGLVYGLAIYAFCALCMTDRRKRWLSFLLIMFASGLGWILVVQKQVQRLPDVPYPLALYVPEADSFLAILGFPHFVVAAAHIVAVFGLFLLSMQRRQIRWSALGGLVALSLGLQHAYDLVTVYGVIGVFLLARAVRARRLPWFEIGAAVVLGVISVGPPAYFFLITTTDPVWTQILDQFVNIEVWTPAPIQLVILTGVLLLLWLAGSAADLWRSRRAALVRVWAALTALAVAATLLASLAASLAPEALGPLPVGALSFAALALVSVAPIAGLLRPNPDESDAMLLIKAWAVTHLFIIYIPLEFQIHLLNPWHIPLSLLAASLWLDRVIPWVQARWPHRANLRALSALLLLVVIPTNLYLFAWRFVDLRRYDYPYFIYDDDAAALHWLDENAADGDVILSSELIGQFIPSMAGGTAFAAHYAMTLDYFDKLAAVESFFIADTDDDWRAQLLREYNIRYVYYGERERALGDFNPEASPMLEAVFTSPRVKVYRVL